MRSVQFSYFFDRTMDIVYLFQQEYKTRHFKSFLLDGELMYLYKSECAEDRDESVGTFHAALGFFDLFSYSTTTAAYLGVNMRDEKVTDRIAVLRDICVALHQEPGSTFWFCKEMWPIEQLADCLSRIVRRNRSDDDQSPYYVFSRDKNMYSLNDGFIFTPVIFPITEGASATQLKWKWLHMLSVDWLITPSSSREDEYKVSVYFHKKNFGHREDVSRHWVWHSSLRVLNPHMLDVRPTESVVAECTYDVTTGHWCIERLRQDKKVANSVVTVISVFECLAEALTLTSLTSALPRAASECIPSFSHLEARGTESGADGIPDGVHLSHKHRCAKMTVRAVKNLTGNHTLMLSSYTPREDNMNPIPFPVCNVEQRGALFDLPAVTDGSCIKNLLYIALGNAGGSEAWSDFVVEAFYDGFKGKWVIVNLHPRGDNKECTFSSVLQHLSWVMQLGGGDRACRYIPHKAAHLPRLVLPSCALPETHMTNEHYASKARELSDKTGKRSNLRVFNNWIKSVLIHAAVNLVKGAAHAPAPPLVVLDVCCGRGGDLPKWKMYSPQFVFMTDSSLDCVGEAAARYSTGHGSTKTARRQHSFDAHFAVFDAFDAHGGKGGLREKIHSLVRRKKMTFNIVSCQFSMHYGCYSKERLAYFVECVASALGTGGLFIGTTVSDEELLRRFKAQQSLSFGNSVYKVTFLPESIACLEHVSDNNSVELQYGIAYQTSVEDSVSNLSEYIVPWRSFTELCEAHHLVLVDSFSFESYYAKHVTTPYGQELLERVLQLKRSRTGDRTFKLTDDEKEAIGIYRGFVFRKVAASH
ncbi:mRNA cap methyltransferase-like protein [Strigomonas culicis]|uniref:mRNA (guanine-N(7))-methyltransferase n=1 Tax=Strigomonas culicis TaxID=28005 RepID=S9UM68_9TRYP|nr:mRNA cap methyltransferase-like protein [Strigomonas culicis]|eukprot:EPY30018.1 mRNA cap methyltransferase-like protein [Strigomonas culicis]